jgi:predicted nucleic acid-binding protein
VKQVTPLKPLLVDTGVIVALLDRSEQYHARCVKSMEGLNRPLVTCEAVIAESCYLLRRLSGAAETVLENVERGVFQIPFQLSRAAAPVRNLLHKYRDLPADFADACLIHLADELNTEDILTLDRDFERYRWRRNRVFRLLVALD